MLPLEHSGKLLTCIERLLVLKTNLWSFYRGSTVHTFIWRPAIKFQVILLGKFNAQGLGSDHELLLRVTKGKPPKCSEIILIT